MFGLVPCSFEENSAVVLILSCCDAMAADMLVYAMALCSFTAVVSIASFACGAFLWPKMYVCMQAVSTGEPSPVTVAIDTEPTLTHAVMTHVYVTTTGDKFHMRSDCHGSSACNCETIRL
jgi:hypothetical protein